MYIYFHLLPHTLINYETEQIDFPNASVGHHVNATANKQAKLLTHGNVCIKFTTSENLPRLVKPPTKQQRPVDIKNPSLMFSNCDI